MTNNIDETELARLEEGARAASKGKWVGNIYGEVLVYGGGRHVLVAECKKPHPLDIESGYKVINALYIAASCNAVPALVAEVRRLREKIEAWEWWEEADLLYGDTGLLFQMRLCAIDELYATLTAAREAVHADRE